MEYKNLRGYLFFAIIGGFVAWMVWGQPRIDVDIESYETKINILQQKIDSIEVQNKSLKAAADSLEVEITSYTKEINKLKIKINVIQKETQEQLDAVDNYGWSELQQFFTERYKRVIDSTQR